MATDSAREARREEVRDPSFTSGPIEKTPSEAILEYVDQDILDVPEGPKIRKTLAPEDYGDIVNDEDTTYQTLFVSDQNAGRIQPPKITGEPQPDIYQQRDEHTQMRVEEWEENVDCVCADGTKSKGRKSKRTGKIDCECNFNPKSKPDVYNPEPNKPRVIDTKPLRDQAGVSYFGNVKMDICTNGPDNEANERAAATLNQVVQIGKETSAETPRGKNVNPHCDTWNIYDQCNYQLYNI